MELKSTRLFINNLRDNINDEDLRSKFSSYGTLTSIEIKERKNPVGNQTSHFAYITLEIQNKALQECMREFSSTKWKGFYVDVQVARESFMDRLKREREETAAQLPSHSLSNGVVGSGDVNVNRNYDIESSYQKVKPTIHIKHSENSVRIPKVTDTIQDDIATQNTKKDTVDNAKRLESLRQMKEGYRQQKQLIKNALSNIESPKSNKIVFDDAVPNNAQKIQKSAPKLTLFDRGEEDDGNIYNFEVREELQGEKGQKLMQLQSRFKNDKRFKMDSRFLEEDTEEVKELDICEEKEKQMEILESVLGQKIKRRSNAKDASIQPNVMLRFDPSQPEHSKYEVQLPKVESKKRKVQKAVVTPEVAPQPEVSKETFYTVESDLKQTLYSSEGFSLSKLFGDKVNEIQEETPQEPFETTPLDGRQTKFETNPFKYDSSEDEEDKEETLTSTPLVEKIEKVQVKPRLWTETFFFKEDDYRLQEGFDFIKRLEVAEQQNFNTVRRNLKEIVKGKVKNNLRKNRPFKRKLGGGSKKRIQIRKALKR